ncbi:MAG: ABC transporter substrate-binding protein [Methanoculleus horonobensis]|nr:ABC transporter substrate-binding protein [Methanoculleus horonobensis]
MRRSTHTLALVLAALVLVAACAGCTGGGTGQGGAVPENGYRTVVDSRGVAVQVPMNIERVVTISDGLVEEVMLVLGEEEKIVGLGSAWSCTQWVNNVTYKTVSNATYEYRGGMQPPVYLYPRIRDLPLIAKSRPGTNFEALAGLDPDVVILRVGDCVLPSMKNEGVQETVRIIEDLGIPVVVLTAHRCYDEPDLSMIYDEISIIGQVFGKKDEAIELAGYLEREIEFVKKRTKDIPDAERPTVLIFAPSQSARKAGAAGIVRGTNEIRSYFIEEVVHAKNACQDPGSPYISTEQLLALDPDVILLAGGHPSEELYSAPDFQNIGELSAIKNHRISSLPWEPCDCAIRLEYPINVMVIAKAAYPERFADVDLAEWLLEFYQKVYGVDRATAEGLRSAQWMDWCVEGWTPARGTSS